MDFKKWNIIIGWIVFALALTTYSLTVEPTASFWDAGEYISTSAKLQVGHPPGAPLYQMLGAFFSTFSPSKQHIALMVNMMSVFSSAFTILFMFWSVSYLIKILVLKNSTTKTLDQDQKIMILASAFIGSLTFTFTDSFWFNAVEAEVYAMASFIMSLLFYLGIRWQDEIEQPRGNRWLILIAFVIGLSFGVHFMGLLTIPAIVFLYYFKVYKKVTLKGFLITNIIAIAVLMFIFKLLLPYTLAFFSSSELFFINSLGMPFNSGTIIAGLAFVAIFYFGLKLTRNKGYTQINTLILCILFIFIGFSSWLMLPIRANAGTVINENNPNNARELLAYYNREQYPETHLFYGPQFTEMYGGLDPLDPYEDDKPKYEKDLKKKKYVVVNRYKNAKQNLENRHKALLPRMWSSEHADNYMRFTGPLGFKIKTKHKDDKDLQRVVKNFLTEFHQGKLGMEEYNKFLNTFSEYIDVDKPSTLSNLQYMFQYQFGYMFVRYFMWNFVGRQNDIQGKWTDTEGNWISGIKPIDSILLGNQDNLTTDDLKNKARNTYYFLPLILGLIGIAFQFNKDQKNFWVLLLFFLFTGIALKVYLNERPFEPRERDYALVGAFYVFAIWIGFGVYSIHEGIKKFISPNISVPLVAGMTLLASPILMGSQNWDDHDRSNKYTMRSMAKMYLDACDDDAILFTIGDNDTFALWYMQDIEEYRTDIRTVNTSLFATDWYIDQMKSKAYESDPIPSQLTHNFYKWGNNDAIYFKPVTNDTLDIKTWMDWIESDDKRTQAELQSGAFTNTFPTQYIRIPVDKQKVLENGIVATKDADLIVDEIVVKVDSDLLYKNRLMMLDIIANNNWERPIYFSGGSFGDDDYLWMKDYLQVSGLVYKLVPIKTPIAEGNPFDMGRIDSDQLYEQVMNWDWGNGDNPDIYHDTETRRNAISYRGILARLIEKLLKEGKIEKAKEVVNLGVTKMPIEYYEYYTLVEPFIDGFYKVNEQEKARELWTKLAKKYQEKLKYFASLELERQYHAAEEIITQVERYRNIINIPLFNGDQSFAKEKAIEFNAHLDDFSNFYNEDEKYDTEEIDRLQEDTIPVIDSIENTNQ